MQKVSSKLMEIGYTCHDENKFALLQHWSACRAGAIKAKMLPLTFSSLSIVSLKHLNFNQLKKITVSFFVKVCRICDAPLSQLYLDKTYL